ncbi:MAG: 4'-phosphopantetheinyl transferase superfamily protein [Flavobacteriales bacterium]|nr:4'-phosphopantetheinyl transferase superfamily protein [Flavobacteriales bacterium]
MPIYQINNVSKTIKVGVWKIIETEEELLNTLTNIGFDKSTISQTKNKQRLKQWLATRILLNDFFDNATITYDDLGKPHLDNDWFISISHSNEFVAINLNKKSHCGIDIEKISKKVERIKHKLLNPTDLQKVSSLEHLTLYWGAKEALYKYYGKKEVLFVENLFITKFLSNKNNLIGAIELQDYSKEIPMEYEKIEDYILVYTL